MRRFNASRSRFLLVVLVVICVQVSLNLLLSRCDVSQRYTREESASPTTKGSVDTSDIISKLHATKDALRALQIKLESNKERTWNITERLREENKKLTSKLRTFGQLGKITNAQEFSKVKNAIMKADFLKGDTIHSEVDVVPFDSFTTTGIYTVKKELLYDRPVVRPLGARSKEHHELLRFCIKVLNNEFSGREKITYNNLDSGITRLDRLNGMLYNLIFTGSKPNEYHRVKIRRPFSNLEVVDSVETIDTSKELINLILPLSGRTNKFQEFLKRFADVCVRWDARVFLTVVYFGAEGRDDAKAMLHDFERKENFTAYKFVSKKGPFSRGAGLQKGVLSWNKGNNIMFFCDVDVYFTPDFLERCRLYTEPGRMVYYPIVYSLYNPEVVYNGAPPDLEKQLQVNGKNGFWRDFGFGMTCQYRNDFISTKGFDTSINGWGIEDLKLYRKFLKTDLTVIRATDRGLFHLYHSKYCDPVLPSEQYLSCLGSKAASEGSHKQMGMLAFGTKLFSNIQPDWKTRLLYKPDFAKRQMKGENTRHLLQKADELHVEALEVKILRKRLQTVLNFTTVGENKFETFNLSILNELESSINKRAESLKLLAKSVERGSTKNEHGGK